MKKLFGINVVGIIDLGNFEILRVPRLDQMVAVLIQALSDVALRCRPGKSAIGFRLREFHY